MGPFFVVQEDERDIGWTYFLVSKIFDSGSRYIFSSSMEEAIETETFFETEESALEFISSMTLDEKSSVRTKVVNEHEAKIISFDNHCNVLYAERNTE